MFSPLKLTGPRALKALVKVDAVERFPMLRGMVSFVENYKHAMRWKDEQVGAQWAALSIPALCVLHALALSRCTAWNKGFHSALIRSINSGGMPSLAGEVSIFGWFNLWNAFSQSRNKRDNGS